MRFFTASHAQNTVQIFLMLVYDAAAVRRSSKVTVLGTRSGFSDRFRRLYALTLDDETTDDTCEKGVRGSRNGGVTLTIDVVLRGLDDEHGKVWPGVRGG
jgi:hypothetical protein